MTRLTPSGPTLGSLTDGRRLPVVVADLVATPPLGGGGGWWPAQPLLLPGPPPASANPPAASAAIAPATMAATIFAFMPTSQWSDQTRTRTRCAASQPRDASRTVKRRADAEGRPSPRVSAGRARIFHHRHAHQLAQVATRSISEPIGAARP